MLGRLVRQLTRALQRRGDASPSSVAVPVPDHSTKTWLLEGDAALAGGRPVEAAAWYERALACNPGEPEALCGLGVASAQNGDVVRAQSLLARAVACMPERVDALHALGNVERELGRPQSALEHLSRAAELAPGSARILASLAAVERELGEPEAACGHLRDALALVPASADLHLEHALALVDAGRPGDARSALDRALGLDPVSARARLARAFELLKDGDFAAGWPDYEARFETQDWRGYPDLPIPRWRGEPLSGRRLLVLAEQGLGDQVMFASCLPDLIRAGARCTVTCDLRLKALFERSFPAVRCIAEPPGAPPDLPDAGASFDLQVPMGSLPGLLRTAPAQFPPHHGYLVPDPARVAALRTRLEALGPGPFVGLSWRGGLARTRRALRSVPLERVLAGLGTSAGTVFVALQYGDCAAEIAAVERGGATCVHHWPDLLADYDETAALVCALDAVVTVCTSLVHLTGALGRPAWVLVPFAPEWRYLRAGERMPWYPSVRLVRQAAPGAWDPALQSIRAALAARSWALRR